MSFFGVEFWEMTTFGANYNTH